MWKIDSRNRSAAIIPILLLSVARLVAADLPPVDPIAPFPDAKMPDVHESPLFTPIKEGGNRLVNSSFELGMCGYALVGKHSESVVEESFPVISYDCQNRMHGRQSLKVDLTGCKQTATLNSHECYGVPGRNLTLSFWVKSTRAHDVLRVCFGDESIERKIGGVRSWYDTGGNVEVSNAWTRVSYTSGKPLNDINRKAVIKISLNGGSVYWLDGLKVEVGDAATEYAPMFDREAAYTARESVLIRREGERIPDGVFELRTVDYDTGRTDRRSVDMNACPYGCGQLKGTYGGHYALPFYYTIVHPLRPNPLRRRNRKAGFFLGVCGLGLRRSIGGGGDVWIVTDGGRQTTDDFCKYMRLAGNAMMRDWVNWVDVEYERGNFDWDSCDRLVNRCLGVDMEPMLCLGSSAFLEWLDPVKDGKRRGWYVRKGSRMARAHAFERWGGMSRMPRSEDWIEHIRGVLSHFRGRVRWYEVINEPNLQLGDPKDYFEILSTAYRTVKSFDRSLTLVGMCVTGDLGGNAGEYADEVGRLGGFEFMDVMSFHPYGAPLDITPVSAERELGQLATLRDRYKRQVPLLQDELFFVCDSSKTVDDQWRRYNWPPGNLIRRAALDLAGGCIGSVSLWGMQYMVGDSCHPRCSTSDTFNFWFGPSDLFAAQNFFAYLLEDAEVVKRPNLPDGLNGVVARTPDGDSVAVVWARKLEQTQTVSLPEGAFACDLYGNRLSGNKVTVSDDPIYIVRKVRKIR